MLYKRWQSACRIRHTVGVCKPSAWGGLYSKDMVLNVQVKGSVKTLSGECKEAECKWTVEDVSKGQPCWWNCRLRCADRTNCNGQLFTGYRPIPLKAGQGALHRLLYETWEAYPLMCKSFAGMPIAIGRLFNRYSTVHTATQFCLRQEKQQEASDWTIVVMIVGESRQ